MYSERLKIRFWSKVVKCSHGDSCLSCCWIWTAAKARGYGSFGIGKAESLNGKKRTYRANRVAWEITYGPIPQGLLVLHNCPDGDNPACVNPAHLWQGTIDDNQKDSMRKGRRPTGDSHGLRKHPEVLKRGEENPQALLTEEDVYAIREYGRLGYPIWQIAEIYPISKSNVGHILHRVTWQHLPDRAEAEFQNHLGVPRDYHRRGEQSPGAKLTDVQVREIRRAAANGIQQKTLANQYRVSHRLISLIVRREIWKHVDLCSVEELAGEE